MYQLVIAAFKPENQRVITTCNTLTEVLNIKKRLSKEPDCPLFLIKIKETDNKVSQ